MTTSYMAFPGGVRRLPLRVEARRHWPEMGVVHRCSPTPCPRTHNTMINLLLPEEMNVVHHCSPIWPHTHNTIIIIIKKTNNNIIFFVVKVSVRIGSVKVNVIQSGTIWSNSAVIFKYYIYVFSTFVVCPTARALLHLTLLSCPGPTPNPTRSPCCACATPTFPLLAQWSTCLFFIHYWSVHHCKKKKEVYFYD